MLLRLHTTPWYFVESQKSFFNNKWSWLIFAAALVKFPDHEIVFFVNEKLFTLAALTVSSMVADEKHDTS